MSPAGAAERPSLDVGDRLGRYLVVEAVARGGMGVIWRGRLEGEYGFRKDVAIKTLRWETAGDARSQQMFLEEARILSRIDHVNVSQILDMGERDGVPYLVLEWVEGPSLAAIAAREEEADARIPLAVVMRVIADTCRGLHAVHELRDARGKPLGIVHRDVSPDNVLVSDQGIAKLIDFGIAKSKNRIGVETTGFAIKGKPAYMAPEQAIGLMLDRRTDIWALGAVLHRLLEGAPPLNDAEARREFIEGTRELPAMSSHVPPAVAAIVARALARDPRNRFATAVEMQQALEEAGAGLRAMATAAEAAAFLRARGHVAAMRPPADTTAGIDPTVTGTSPAAPMRQAVVMEPVAGASRGEGRAVRIAAVVLLAVALAGAALVTLRRAPSPGREPGASETSAAAAPLPLPAGVPAPAEPPRAATAPALPAPSATASTTARRRGREPGALAPRPAPSSAAARPAGSGPRPPADLYDQLR